jgi:RHS repeat-associated protein
VRVATLAGQLTSLTLPSDPVGQHTAYAYDRAGLPTSRSLPDGSVADWGYDSAGRLTSLSETMPSGVLSFAYERDANGQVTAENDTRYGYDALNRVTSWYDPSADSTTTYAYDANYNLTSVSVDGTQTRALSYDAADRIDSPGYVFDDDGNMTSDGTRTYAYDALNRLSQVTDATGTVIASYAYDFMNRRVSATDATGTTYFHYDGASPDVIAETDGSGHTIASYAYETSGRIHSMTRGGETYYYHANAHGDVVALTDSAGTVAASYRYDPWGRVLAASGTVANPYRYAGYRYDEPTGLYHLWNRYYSPSDFRFITKDLYPGETRAPGTMNGYAYCLGDPVNAVDPSGLISIPVIIGIVVIGLAVIALLDEAAYLIYEDRVVTDRIQEVKAMQDKVNGGGGCGDPELTASLKETSDWLAAERKRNWINNISEAIMNRGAHAKGGPVPKGRTVP